jgi:hypothetical protein
MTALLIVRATVVDTTARDAFDRWYQEEHLPDAKKAFHARRAWRGWSEIEPGLHYAFYEFNDLLTAQKVADSDEIKLLIAEFDRLWESRVTRTRDIVETRQLIDPLEC